MRNERVELSTDPTEINNTFVSYYKILYSSDSPPNLVNQNSFLDGLTIPRISKDSKAELDRELDISSAITNKRGDKVSG